MYIEKITLRNFRRFSLNDINEFIYTPKERVQIILGSNGSGKSSLLDQLSPLPADLNKDFKDGGFKEVVIKHNNNDFILTSGIVKKKHSFKKDNVELNQGGTRKVQLILVKEHLSYTPLIHEVFIGRKTFTNMSTQDRKNWFSSISSIDFTYAVGVYDKLKSNYRDISGVVRIMNTRLIELEKEVMGDNEIATLEKVKSGIHDVIDDLLTNLKPVEDATDNLEDLKSISNNLDSLLNTNINVNLLTNRRIELLALVTSLEMETDKLLQDKDELSKIETADVKDSLLVEKEEVSIKLAEIKKTLYLDVNIDELSKFLYTNSSNIYDILNNLSILEEVTINPVGKREIERLLEKKLEHMETVNETLYKLTTDYNIMKEMGSKEDIVCPNCSHTWKHNFNKNDFFKLERQINIDTDKVKVLEIDINSIKDKLTNIESKTKLLNELKFILNNDIGKAIVNLKGKVKQSLLVVMEGLNISIDSWLTIKDLEVRYKTLEEKSKLVSDVNNQELINKQNVLVKTIETNYSTLQEFKQELQTIDRDLKIGNKIELLTSKLKQGLYRYSNYVKNKDLIELNKIKTYTVNELRKELNMLDMKLNEVKIIKAKLLDHNSVLEEQKARQEAISKLMQALSPTEGLIASSISNYLSNFTDHMNYIIEKAWNYNMQILPASLTPDKDLDYKFPVRTDNDDMPDVSMTSTGMQEIINLAFKLMSMARLGLQDYPLILDEFGKAMDDVHRQKAFSVIDSSVTSKSEQIFIVSHYEESYGRFSNADLIVLSDNNLDLSNDRVYNSTIKIK